MIKRVLVRQRAKFRASSGLRGSIYRIFTVYSFWREIGALRAGQVRHMTLREKGSERYSLRRHIHMIEKGLVMQPRRPVFAEAYIEETVDVLCRLDEVVDRSDLDIEIVWAVSVLRTYFNAVSLDDSAAASQAFTKFLARFEGAGANVSFDSRSAPFEFQSTERPTINPDDFERLLSNRSSVRWFTSTRVPRAVLDRASMAAAEAPSACNRQPYRIILVDDQHLVSAVAAIPGGTKGYADNIPCLAVFVGDLSAFSEERDRHLIYIDTSLAAMSFILSLEVDGLASCCINWPDVASRDARLRAVLNIMPHEAAVMLVAVGYADPSGYVPSSKKKPVDLVRQYNDISR